MITTTTPTSNQLIVTVDESVNIAHITQAIKMLRGVTAISRPTRRPATRTKALYSTETGKALNKKTMKAIEEAEQGKGMVEVNSMEDYLKLVENL